MFQLPDGVQHQRRDQGLKAEAAAGLDWLYGYDAEAATSDVLANMVK